MRYPFGTTSCRFRFGVDNDCFQSGDVLQTPPKNSASLRQLPAALAAKVPPPAAPAPIFADSEVSMLFVFRAAGFGFLAALLLAPWFSMNNTLDKMANTSRPALSHETADHILRRLGVMKQEIRADMCRRIQEENRREGLCLMGLCLPDPCANSPVTGSAVKDPATARRDTP